MKTLLVFPALRSIYGIPNYPPLGLSYLSASLSKSRIEHDVIDLRLYSNWEDKFTKKISEGFDIVGITATTFGFDQVEKLARIIKEISPNSLVVLGGAHPTLINDKILKKNKNIDFIIVGEGEHAIVELCQSITKKLDLKKIKGLIFRKGDKVTSNINGFWNCDLDNLPFPDYDKFNLNEYHGDTSFTGIIKKRKILPILTSRGCPFECIYCSVYLASGNIFRVRSPENVVNEIEFMKKKYNAGIFDFLDDNFTLDVERAKKICKLIIDKKLKIQWGPPNGIRVDKIDEELVKLMKKSGCNGIALGIESVDDNVLKKLKKHTTFKQIENAVYLFKKHKIPIKAFFLIGSPGGSKEEVKKSFEFAFKNKIEEARFSMLTPYPGTELFNWVTKNKYWITKQPEIDIIKYTHEGSLKSLYEEPSFTSTEKEKVYAYVSKRWKKHEEKGNLSLKIRRYIISNDILYKILKGLRDKLKNSLS